MSLSTLILSLVFIINVGLLLYVLFQPKSERQNPIFVMVLLVVLWELSEFLNVTILSQDQFLLILGVQSGLLPTLYLAPAFVWLVFSLFGTYKNLGLWKKILIWSPAILMSPFVFTNYNASNIFIYNGQVYYDAGIIYWFFALYFSLLMTYSFYVLCKNRKKANRIVKSQINYIFIGTILAALGGLIFSILLPVFGKNNFYYIGANCVIFFTCFTVHGLFSYRFYDLGVSFYKAIKDLLGLFIVGFVFYTLYWLLNDVVFIDFSKNSNLVWLLVFIGITAPILFRLVNRSLVSFLINPDEQIKEIEDKIADILRDSRDLDVLFSRLAKQIDKVVDYKEIFIYLSKRKNPDVFYQVFPAGERLIDKSNSVLLQYLAEHRQIVDLAEIEYFGKNNELYHELSAKKIDIVLPIFYNRQLLGLVIIDNNKRVLSVQQIEFLAQVIKYLDIAIGSLLLHQQDMVESVK